MRLEDKPKNTELVIQHYNKAFEKILDIFQVREPDAACKNLAESTDNVTSMVLWLYSIEPPLYFHFNDACRTRNFALIHFLGPFAMAMDLIS